MFCSDADMDSSYFLPVYEVFCIDDDMVSQCFISYVWIHLQIIKIDNI